MKKRLNSLIIYGIFLLAPFERLLSFDIAGYTVKLAYALSILFVVGSVLSWMQKIMFMKKNANTKSRLEIQTEEYLLMFFVAWTILSTVWSLSPIRTLIMSCLLVILIAMFMLFRRAAHGHLHQILIKIIIWSGLVTSILALYQFLAEPIWGHSVALLREQYGSRVFGFPRPHATFLEPLYLANFLLFPIFLEINQKLKIPASPVGRKNQKYSGHLVLIIMLIAFILTLSRGAYLGLAVGFTVCILVLIVVKKINWRTLGIIFTTILISIVVSLSMIYLVAGKIGLNNFINHAVKTRDLPPTNEIEVLKNRELSRKIASQSIKNKPLNGIGLAAFGALPQYQLLRENGEWQTANNQYLEITAELGLVGLLIFLVIIILAIKYQLVAVKKGKYDNVVYLGWLLAVLVQYFTFSTLYLLYIWVFLAIIWPRYEQDSD